MSTSDAFLVDNKVLEDDCGLWIPFKTASDALIAQLMLVQKFPSSTVDLFLGILSHPNFKIEQVTIKRGTDVDKCVSDHRRDIAFSRCVSVETAGMPDDILTTVIDIVAARMCHVFEESGYILGTHPDIAAALAIRTLICDLALVHRTWTPMFRERFVAASSSVFRSSYLALFIARCAGRRSLS